MERNAEDVLKEALTLSEADRAEVAGALLNSLEPVEEAEIESAWRQEVAASDPGGGPATFQGDNYADTGECAMNDWNEYVNQYYAMTPEQQRAEWEKLTPEQKVQFEAARSSLHSQPAPNPSAKGWTFASLAAVGCAAVLALSLLGLGVLGLIGALVEDSDTEVAGGQAPEVAVSSSAAEILASAKEGGWQNVDLLVSSGDPLEAAKDCVQRRVGATSCYVFLTREAYEVAQPTNAGNFTLTCWAARWTRNKVGTVSGGLNDFMPSACPASSKFERSKPANIASAKETASEPYELKLTLEPTATNTDQILLQGTTNLPNGTELSMSVSGGGFMGQDEAVVNDARWQSGPFGPRTGLDAGTYEASVTLPYGRTQPEKIQAQLGRRLENLTGPLMETNPELEFMGQTANVKAIVRVR